MKMYSVLHRPNGEAYWILGKSPLNDGQVSLLVGMPHPEGANHGKSLLFPRSPAGRTAIWQSSRVKSSDI
jgi:hypothetical protein